MPLSPPSRYTSKVAAAVLVTLTLLASAAPAAGAAPLLTEPLSAEPLSVEPLSAGSKLAEPRWAWPIEAPHAIERAFAAPATPYSSGHRGIDIRTGAGAAVYAPAPGIVHYSGLVAGRPVISIEHPGGLISSFEPVVATLVTGEVVGRGELIGHILGASQSGHCGAPCLHFGVRLHGQYVSPLNYLGGVPRSVLLPTRPLG